MTALVKRVWTLLALAACLGSAFEPALARHAALDVECGEVSWAANHHATTQVERPIAPIHEDHCTLCHLQRTVRGATTGAAVVLASPRQLASIIRLSDGHPKTVAAAQLPSRAPPALL